MNIDKLSAVLSGEPKFRYKQVNKLIFGDLISNWTEASVLPKVLRETLTLECPLEIRATEMRLKNGAKALIEFDDGKMAETVLIRNRDKRYTVCVSSQIGCPLGCTFCATGAMGFTRNLKALEIVEQVLFFARKLKTKNKKIDNIVFMGMGEPFLNTNEVFSAIKILNDSEKFGIGARKLSISTSGVKQGIDQLARNYPQVNLAISLHAPNDKLRTELMPINQSFPLKKLLATVDAYIERTGRQVMFEYVMIDGVNDSASHARELATFMKPLYMLNLIRYNNTGKFRASSPARIENFRKILLERKVRVTVRESFGEEIGAACGQLAGK